MKKSIIFISALLVSHFCYATSPSIKQFVPKNWEIISKAQGDLNQDRKDDFAIIIQPKNQTLQNRKLLILMSQKNRLHLNLSKKIPNWTYSEKENCINDAIESGGISIHRGVLDLTFAEMNACSNWYGISSTYRFQWQTIDFKLIGFEYNFFNKNNGESTNYSGNFLTHKLKTTLKNERIENVTPKISWKTLAPIQPDHFSKIQFEQSDGFLKQMLK